MFATLWARLRAHLAPFADARAWVLILGLSIAYMVFIDPVMFKAVMSWVPQWLAFPALLVIVSRYIFPMISLSSLMAEVDKGNVAAAIVVLSIVLFVAIGLISVSLWGRVV